MLALLCWVLKASLVENLQEKYLKTFYLAWFKAHIASNMILFFSIINSIASVANFKFINSFSVKLVESFRLN